MKDQKLFRQILVAFIMLFAMLYYDAYGQVPTIQAIPDTTKITYNQISQSLGLFVFPSKNQSQSNQKQDEFECYKWAINQSGIDPQNIPKIEVTDPLMGIQSEKMML